MTKVTNTVGIVVLAIVIMVLCVWRASTSDLTHWSPMDYIGIIGFGFTLITAWYVFFIKRDIKQLSNKYSLKLALPLTLKRMMSIRKGLMGFLNDHADTTKTNVAILEIVANCLSECDSLAVKIRDPSVEFPSIREITVRCREIHYAKHVSVDDLTKLYLCVHKLIKDIDKKIQDMNNEVQI